MVGRSGGLFDFLGPFDCDVVAERLELALQPAGAMLDRVALVLPVGAELSERHSVADDVVVGDEDVVADRADRFGLAASCAQLGEVGGEVGALGADGGPRALGQLVGQPTRTGAGSSRAPATG